MNTQYISSNYYQYLRQYPFPPRWLRLSWHILLERPNVLPASHSNYYLAENRKVLVLFIDDDMVLRKLFVRSVRKSVMKIVYSKQFKSRTKDQHVCYFKMLVTWVDFQLLDIMKCFHFTSIKDYQRLTSRKLKYNHKTFNYNCIGRVLVFNNR